MKKPKQLLVIFISLCLLLYIAACDWKIPPSSNRNKHPHATCSGFTDYTPTSLFGDLSSTKLRVADNALLEEWEETFYIQLEEETGMTVEIIPMTDSELNNKIAQAVASGDRRNYFDVAKISTSNLIQQVYTNLIMPIDMYLDREDPALLYPYTENLDFFAPDIFKIGRYSYGIPTYDFHENYIFYNKAIFQKMGIPDPYEEYYLKDNWTFETFLQTCEATTKNNQGVNSNITAFATSDYFTFLAAAGNPVVQQTDSGKWEVIIDKPNGMAGLDLLYNSAKSGWFDPEDYDIEEFLEGEIAMIIDKPSAAIGFAETKDEIGLLPLPKWNDTEEKYFCALNASGYGIAACTQNSAGAAAYCYYRYIAEQKLLKKNFELGLAVLNQEAMDRRTEYISKCEFIIPLGDGLNDWLDKGVREEFWNKLFSEHLEPASAIDDMSDLIRKCLKITTG